MFGSNTHAWFRVAALSGATAVLLGAFGAHALAKSAAVAAEPRLLKTWETAAQYHLIHAGALAIAALVRSPLACVLFGSGTALFSGSLYLLVVSGKRWLGAVTPVGGLLLTAGWAALAAGAYNSPLLSDK
jgi:uncharacterized membrane protein YgdD (TMEM256/DUF423 family)